MKNGIVEINAVNLRDYTHDRHQTVDDKPFGGGPGMLMKPEPLFEAVEALRKDDTKVILTGPRGEQFSQKIASELAQESHLVIVCGHYEGVDERVLEMIATDYLSAGDYVLTGGELPAMMMIDCISRLVPGVLNNNVSAEFETFHDNLLEYPQYTRPVEFRGRKVPDVLLSGHHGNIDKWRREQSLKRTLERRPDLIETAILSKEDEKYLKKLKKGLHESE